MRLLPSILALSVAAIASLPAALAQADDTPTLKITTTFPSNPLSIVHNGQANKVVFHIQNPRSEDRILALTGITGAWLDPKKADGARGRVLRNMTVTPYKSLSLRSVSGKPLEVPFDFYPEFKPQTLGIDFRLLVVDGQTGKKHSIPAYTGSVTVIEPAKNWLDPQLWSLYLIGAALVAAAGYFALQQLAPKTKGSKRTGGGSAASGKTPVVTASSTSVNAKGYDEDWIPEHHLKKSSSRIRSDDGLSSGDEGRKSPSGKRRGGRK